MSAGCSRKSTCGVQGLAVLVVLICMGGCEGGLRDPLMAWGVFDDSCSNLKLTGVSYTHLIFVIKSHHPSD